MSQKLTAWPNKMALIISESPNLYMFLKELLRSLGWSVLKDTPSVAEAIQLINDRQVFLIIVDDTIDLPAASIIRELLSYTAGFATPIFSFALDDHREEQKVLAQFGEPELQFKPLTPSRFIPGFTQLIRRWESKPYIALRAGFSQYLQSNQPEARQRIFTMLGEVAPIAHLATPALAIEYRQSGMLKEAERVLLQYLKNHPRDVGCLVTLADLYLHSAMPLLAKRLLSSAQKLHPHSCCLLPDLVQAEILLGDMEEAILRLETMVSRKYWLDECLPILTRLLHVQGRGKEAENIMGDRKGLFQKINFSYQRASS